MKQILLSAITALLLITPTGCATATAMASPLGGNPKILEMESNIGKSGTELIEELGNPAKSGECQVSFRSPITEKIIPVPGVALIWSFETGNVKDQSRAEAQLSVCLVKGKVVSELREWIFVHEGRIGRGQNEFLDLKLIQDLLTSPSKGEPIIPRGKEFAI